MNFFRRRDLSAFCLDKLAHYDRQIAAVLGSNFSYPLRMRDWELYQVLLALDNAPRSARILDTGSFNTYLGLYLAKDHPNVVVSDLLKLRRRKSILRRLRLAPSKSTEIFYFTWMRIMRNAGILVRDLDLTRLNCADSSVDFLIALSVIEHIPAVEQALKEMYRVLAPGGKLLITTDCAPQSKPYANGVRYFSEAELNQLFAPFQVTSSYNQPDFSRENWCYGGKQPVVTAFIEITKPAEMRLSASAETDGG